jgi:hypothetical protein
VVTEYSAGTKHSTDFNRTEAIANIHTYHPHINREATEITKHPDNFNDEDRYRFSKVWLQIFPPSHAPNLLTLNKTPPPKKKHLFS